MIWKILPDRIADICHAWREQLSSSLDWEQAPDDLPTGEAAGFKVVANDIPFGAYLKPTKPNSDDLPRSANEKICADLANDVSLPVPPAVLYVRNKAPDNEESHVVLSLILADRVWRYKDIEQVPNPPWNLVEDALRRGSGTLGFDTWVGHQDRNNKGNLVFFQNPESGDYQVAYIDYAYTLNRNRRWEKGDPAEVSFPDFLPKILDHIDADRVRDGIDSIEDLMDEDVRVIVERIPDEFMAADHRAVVVRALLDRKSEVRSTLEDHLSI